MPTRKRPSPEARRQREYRRRQRDGVSLVRLEVGPAVKKALVKRKWLSKADTYHPGIMAEAIDDLLDCWVRGTLDPDPTRQANRYRITGSVAIGQRKGYFGK